MSKKVLQLKLTTADIATLQACSDSYARGVVRKIKASLGKTKDQFITPREYAKFYGLELIELYDSLGWEMPLSLREKQS